MLLDATRSLIPACYVWVKKRVNTHNLSRIFLHYYYLRIHKIMSEFWPSKAPGRGPHQRAPRAGSLQVYQVRVLDNRCVVCHVTCDAVCQFNQGLPRDAFPTPGPDPAGFKYPGISRYILVIYGIRSIWESPGRDSATTEFNAFVPGTL